MIKGSSFLKSFVLGLFTLGISCFIFGVGSSVSAIFSQNTYYYYYDTRFPTIQDNYTYYVSNNGSFKTDYGDYSTNSFFWVADGGTYSTYNFGWLNGRLYFSQYYGDNNSVQGYLQNWCISPVSSRLSNGKNLHSDCVFDKSINDIKEIMLPFTEYAFESIGWSSPEITNNSSSPFMFCLSDSLFDYCVSCSVGNCPSGITGSQNYNLSSFSNVRGINFTPSPFNVNYISTSTGVNSTLTGNLITSTGGLSFNSREGAIAYYENQWNLNKSVCYAGIDNLSVLYGDRCDNCSFNEGKGLTIFEVFTGYYANSNNYLNRVPVWLEVWGSNYLNWYNKNSWYNGEPKWLESYDYNSNNISMYYTGLSFPFANNPVAFYYISDFLFGDYSPINSVYKQPGDWDFSLGIVQYCNLKLNNASFDSLSDSTKNNVNDYIGNYNVSKGYNEDGTRREAIDLSQFFNYTTSGSTELKDGKTFVSDSFNLLQEVYYNPNEHKTGSRGILPNWIIIPFLALLFFRFLSR